MQVAILFNQSKDFAVFLSDKGDVSIIKRLDDFILATYFWKSLKSNATLEELETFLSSKDFWTKTWQEKKVIDKEVLDGVLKHFWIKDAVVGIEVVDSINQAVLDKLKEFNPIVDLNLI